MNETVKKTIALVAAAILLGIAYYGSYLPMRKSQAFIAVLRNANTARSLDQFLGMFANVFAMPSPIGQEELVRNFTGSAIGLVSGQNLPPQAVGTVVQFVDDSFAAIVDRGRGMSFTQNLYTLGNLYQVAYLKTRDPKYIQKAQLAYEEGLRRAPERPQFLYGLLDVYRMAGNPEGVGRVGNKIIELWKDQRVKVSLDEFFAAFAKAQQQAAAASSTSVK